MNIISNIVYGVIFLLFLSFESQARLGGVKLRSVFLEERTSFGYLRRPKALGRVGESPFIKSYSEELLISKMMVAGPPFFGDGELIRRAVFRGLVVEEEVYSCLHGPLKIEDEVSSRVALYRYFVLLDGVVSFVEDNDISPMSFASVEEVGAVYEEVLSLIMSELGMSRSEAVRRARFLERKCGLFGKVI